MPKARHDNVNGPAQVKGSGDLTDDRPAKRTRVSRACDQCRASREKCDGSQPHCQSCLSQDRECTYNEAPKKRGIQPNYIRTLELLLAWTLEQSPDVRQHLCESLPHESGQAHRLLAGKDPEAAEKLHQTWRSSTIGRQVDQVLSGTAIEPPPSTSENGFGTDVSQRHLFALSEDGTEQPDLHLPTNTADTAETVLKLPENAWTLLDYYFAFTHAFMPMTEKASMMRLLYAYPANGVPLRQVMEAEHAELWSIMAVASHQIAHDDTSRQSSLKILQTTETLVPTGQTYEVPHLKAMILLTLIDMSEKRTLDAWLRIGTVVRLLSLFKLLERLDTMTRWCKHVHLAAFLLEAALALHLNVQGHLTPAYIENIGFISEDGRDEWDPWQDPLAATFTVSRAPAKAFSTLNKLVRVHMQHIYAESGHSNNAPIDTTRNIVYDLLTNASRQQGRLQPAVLLENAQGSRQNGAATLAGDENPDSTSPTWSSFSQPLDQQLLGQTYPHIGIPNELPEMPPATIAPSALDVSSSAGAGDIFQELAMLERTDSSSQFMQNLGFAPDLDLQEFFGDVYQASDPMLAMMAPVSQYGAS